jgi:polar amino acid transport system substrate-binding protein
MRRLLILLCLLVPAPLAASAACPGFAAGDLIQPGHLVMSTNPTLPPLQYVDRDGQLKGMRIELGTEIARRLCLVPDYVRIDFDAMVPGLAARRWDMIDTGIFYTPARAKIMRMIPYEMQAISISVPKGATSVASLDDLAGKTVGVEIGGFEESKAHQIAADFAGRGLKPMTVRTFDTFAVAYQALAAGQVDAVVSIDGVAAEYQTRGSFTRALGGLFPTPVALAFRGRALADAVAGVLPAMKKDGTYDALFARYGLAPYPKPFVVDGPAD